MDKDDRLTRDLARDLDAAFDDLVIGHQDRLYTIALRLLGDPRDAEEATQDALVRAYRALASYEPARIRALRLRGWLTTIVLNRCRTVGTRRAARGQPPLPLERPDGMNAEPESGPSTAPASIAERRDERDQWARRLAALPLPYRTAIVLRHVDGLAYPEIATVLGRPEGTVKAQVHRGIAMLRRIVDDERAAPAGTTEMTA
ncbi:RNA polymerase sigma factor RpoE [soil metagenome]